MRNTASTAAALFLLLLASPAVARLAPTTSPPSNNIFEHHRGHVRFPSVEIFLIVVIGALYISFQYCSKASAAVGASVRRGLSIRSRRAAESRGLDASVIESFPTFSYSDHFRIGNECAVCLSEFEDGETLRQLPTCGHVFHPECIDAWLACHVTCPVCRADLSPPPPPPFEVVVQVDDGINNVR